MAMTFTFNKRVGLVYAGALVVACLLLEISGALVGGLAAGFTIARSPEYQAQVGEFLAARGLDAGADAAAVREAYAKLTPEDRAELSGMSTEVLRSMNWFGVLILVSLIGFVPVGILSGWLAREWWPSGLVPALTFLINNPLVRFPMARELGFPQQAGIVLLQFTVCMGLAVLGAQLALKQQRTAPQRDGVGR